MNLKCKKVHPDAKLPTKAYDSPLGYDFYCIRSDGFTDGYNLQPGERFLFSTGIACEFPSIYIKSLSELFEAKNEPVKFGMFLKPRSGLALRDGVHVMAGCIDWDWTDEIKVLLVNLSDEPVTISPGDKICQGVLIPVFSCEVEEVNEIENRERGNKGFGSSD